MRRMISYIVLCSAVILGVGISVAPTVVHMDADVSYRDGKELVFHVSEKNSTVGGVDPDHYMTDKDPDAVTTVADEIKSRLSGWGTSDYSVETQGFDTVTVTFRSQNNDDTEYQYLEKYLAFSGQNISLSASLDGSDTSHPVATGYAVDKSWNDNNMFEGKTARIEYVNSVPVVVIPVTQTGKSGAMSTLVNYCTNNSTAANSSQGTSAYTVYLLMWNNKQEGDTYIEATKTGADANIKNRLIFAESGANAWYKETNSDDDNTEFQLLPNSDALSESGYDSSKAGAAFMAAKFYMSLLNASSYAYDVNFAFSTNSVPTVESLVTAGAWSLYPSLGATMIATLIGYVIICLILVLFYRLGALSIIASMSLTTFASLAFFAAFGVQFGVGTVLGMGIVALLSMFGGIYYQGKFRNEIYKGRTLKKANSEATKKSLWPILDLGIVSVIIGLFVYLLAGSLAAKTGLFLVLGGFFSILVNLIFLSVENWLLANDSTVSSGFGKLLNLDKTKIPDMLKDEKQTYFGAYQDRDFTKHKKATAIGAGIVVAAGIACMIVFGIINGTVYNYSGTYDQTTVVYVEYRVLDSTSATKSIAGVETIENDILPLISKDGTAFDSKAYSSVIEEDGTVYITANTETYNVYNYVISLNDFYDINTEYSFTVKVAGVDKSYTYIQDAVEAAVNSVAGDYNSTTGEGAITSVKSVTPSEGAPDLGALSLGLGVGLAVCALYMMLRFRPSRGFAATLLAAVAGYSSLSFFVFTRIAVTPLVALGSIGTAMFCLVGAIFILGREQDIIKESREKDKTALAFRSLSLKQAGSYGAGEFIIFALLAAYIAIDLFGFGPSAFSLVYLNWIVGIAISAVFVLVLLAPLSTLFATWLSKIHVNFHFRHKDKGGQPVKKKSAEPEEAVFIGIND